MARNAQQRTYSRSTGLERGRGWVEQTRSGRWQARPGKGQRSLGTFETRDDAIAALREAVVITDVGRFGDYVDDFIKLRSTRWSERTLENYRWYADRKISPAIGDLFVHELDQRAINEWWINMSAATGALRNGEVTNGQTTCAKTWRFLRMILKQADRDGLILHPITEPVHGAGREHSPERVLLTEAQVSALLEHLPANRRLVAILAATCGLRFSEILGLQRQDIDYVKSVISIRQVISERSDATKQVKEPKSTASRRSIPVHSTVLALIDEHLESFVADASPTAHLVTTRHRTPLSRTTWGSQWRRARRLAGLDGLRPAIGIHDLRHHALTYASSQTNQLKDVMALAGHSTSSAALRYQHRSSSDLSHLARPFRA